MENNIQKLLDMAKIKKMQILYCNLINAYHDLIINKYADFAIKRFIDSAIALASHDVTDILFSYTDTQIATISEKKYNELQDILSKQILDLQDILDEDEDYIMED